MSDVSSLTKMPIGPVLLRGGKVHYVRIICHVGTRNVFGETAPVSVSVDCRIGNGAWNAMIDAPQSTRLDLADLSQLVVINTKLDLTG